MALSDTPQVINLRNARFWLRQNELTSEYMEDEVIYNCAMEDPRSEAARGVPIKSQKTIEKALADAVKMKKAFHVQLSRKGGRAPKGDALQTVIEGTVKKDPNIKEYMLTKALLGEAGASVVISIDCPSEGLAGVREIRFVEANGTPKTAALSGLKDRLFRAKKKLRAKPVSAKS